MSETVQPVIGSVVQLTDEAPKSVYFSSLPIVIVLAALAIFFWRAK